VSRTLACDIVEPTATLDDVELQTFVEIVAIGEARMDTWNAVYTTKETPHKAVMGAARPQTPRLKPQPES
jgi:hypothetical protein